MHEERGRPTFELRGAELQSRIRAGGVERSDATNGRNRSTHAIRVRRTRRRERHLRRFAREQHHRLHLSIREQ